MHGPFLLGGDFVFLVPLQPQLSDEISYDFVKTLWLRLVAMEALFFLQLSAREAEAKNC